MTWMRTVRRTLLACMRSRSCSTEASSAGGFAPGAKGKAGVCFQTWTWESMSGEANEAAGRGGGIVAAAEVMRKRRRLHMVDPGCQKLRCILRDFTATVFRVMVAAGRPSLVAVTVMRPVGGVMSSAGGGLARGLGGLVLRRIAMA